jgi:hypothetical protein
MGTGLIGSEQRRASERYGQRYQLHVSQGAGRHSRAAPWALDRVQYHHVLPPWGHPINLKLPKDAPEPSLTETPAPRPRAAAAAAAAPEQMAWAWVIDRAGDPLNAQCVSTPAIPWPFRVVGFHGEPGLPTAVRAQLNIFVTDEEFTTLTVPVNQEALTPLISSLDGGVLTKAEGWQSLAGLQAVGSPQPRYYDLATATVGRTIGQANKRLTIAIYQTSAAQISWSGTITVERWEPTVSIGERVTTPRVSRVVAVEPTAEGTTPLIIDGRFMAGAAPSAISQAPPTAPRPRRLTMTPAPLPSSSAPPGLPRIGFGPDATKDRAQLGGLPPPPPPPKTAATPAAKKTTPAPTPGGLSIKPGGTPFLGFVPTPAPPKIVYVPTGQENKPFYR